MRGGGGGFRVEERLGREGGAMRGRGGGGRGQKQRQAAGTPTLQAHRAPASAERESRSSPIVTTNRNSVGVIGGVVVFAGVHDGCEGWGGDA